MWLANSNVTKYFRQLSARGLRSTKAPQVRFRAGNCPAPLWRGVHPIKILTPPMEKDTRGVVVGPNVLGETYVISAYCFYYFSLIHSKL